MFLCLIRSLFITFFKNRSCLKKSMIIKVFLHLLFLRFYPDLLFSRLFKLRFFPLIKNIGDRKVLNSIDINPPDYYHFI